MKRKIDELDELKMGIPVGFFSELPPTEEVYIVFRGHHDTYPVGSMLYGEDSQVEDSDIAKKTPFEAVAIAAYYLKEDAEAAIAKLNKDLGKDDVHYKYIPEFVSDLNDPYHIFPNVDELYISHTFTKEFFCWFVEPVTQFLDEEKLQKELKERNEWLAGSWGSDHVEKLVKIPFIHEPEESTKRRCHNRQRFFRYVLQTPAVSEFSFDTVQNHISGFFLVSHDVSFPVILFFVCCRFPVCMTFCGLTSHVFWFTFSCSTFKISSNFPERPEHSQFPKIPDSYDNNA